MHVGLDSRKPGPQNDFDPWIPLFDKGPRRIGQRYYMYKDCKNKCKLETSRPRGWLIGPFMKSTFNLTAKDLLQFLGSCLEQLEMCMKKPDTFHVEKTFLLNR